MGVGMWIWGMIGVLVVALLVLAVRNLTRK
jgi:hypothetical protein